MLLNLFESRGVTCAIEGTCVITEAGEFAIAHKGAKAVAVRGSFVIAKEYSFVVAKNGSCVVALRDSFVVREPGARVHSEPGSLVIVRSLECMDHIYFARKKGEIFPQRSMIIAYPGAQFKTGYSSIILAPDAASVEVQDFSQVYAGNHSKITADRNCKIIDQDGTCTIQTR